MNKNDFLNKLEKAMSGLPQEEIQKTLDYYSEIIGDAVEEGESAKDVIERFDSAEEIAGKIINDTPLSKLVKEDVKRRNLSTREIIFIIIGSPIWIPILISVLAIIFSIYISIWSIVASIFAVSAALALSGVALAVLAPFLMNEVPFKAMFLFGTALISIGASVFVFYLAMWCAKLTVKLTVFIMRNVKTLFIRRRSENI